MKNTKIKLTLGSLQLTEQNILHLEITSSVFLAGEIGSCTITLPKYDDIYKLQTVGTLNLSDSNNPEQFWPQPLQIVVIDTYSITYGNGMWIISFSFINKY